MDDLRIARAAYLLTALTGSMMVALYASFMPEEVESAALAVRAGALRSVIGLFAAMSAPLAFLPLVAAVILAFFLRGDDPAAQRNAKWLALIATSATFLVSLFLLAGFDPSDTGFQFVEEREWVLGLNYKVGVDGISILFVMLTTGLTAQLAAVPTELDASFRRALPLLRDRYLNQIQAEDARNILLASSSTYIAASLLSVLNFWPWIGVPRGSIRFLLLPWLSKSPTEISTNIKSGERKDRNTPKKQRRIRTRAEHKSPLTRAVRIVGKPLIRGWLQMSRSLCAQ